MKTLVTCCPNGSNDIIKFVAKPNDDDPPQYNFYMIRYYSNGNGSSSGESQTKMTPQEIEQLGKELIVATKWMKDTLTATETHG